MVRTKKDMGRPRKYDLKKEAEDLLKWSEKSTSTCLYQFTDDKDYLAQDLSKFSDADVDFKLALLKAKERIARRREDAMNRGKINYGAWNRWAGFYSQHLHDYEEGIKDKDMERKKKIAAAEPAEKTIVIKATNYCDRDNAST